jgi:hypothetical protein
VAICNSPRLSRIERWVVDTYDDLADRIGPREARAIADVQLSRRQACGGDPVCIEERLVATMQVFVANGAPPRLPLEDLPSAELAAREPTAPEPPIAEPTIAELTIVEPTTAEPAIPELALVEPPAAVTPRPSGLRPLARPERALPDDLEPDGLELPSPEERLAMGPPLEVEPADRPEPLPDAALAPFPGLEPDEPDSAEPPVTEVALPRRPEVPLEAAPESALEFGAGPEPRADPDSALVDAFAALPAYRRGNVQGRLTEAGYGEVATSGSWDVATAAALAAFAREAAEHGRTFDPTTPEGAAALLGYVESDGFRQTFLGEDVASGPEW